MMTEPNRRGWFIARNKKGSFIYYLISAYDLKDAMESMGCLVETYQFKELTYADIDKLLGTRKPINADDNNTAKGDISFKIGKEILVLRVSH
jgi:hypothetical protein